MKEGCSIKEAARCIEGKMPKGNLPSGEAPKEKREDIRKVEGRVPSKNLAKA